MKDFTGKPFSGQNYQDIIDCLLKNNFEVFLESPIATAIHETLEEHGVDLRKDVGKDNHLLVDLFEFMPQIIQAKRGTTNQKIIVAYLEGNEGVELKHTNKIEQKIRINEGREFYEEGAWKTLDDIKLILVNEQTKHAKKNNFDTLLNQEQLELISAELKAFESRIQLLEKIEKSIVNHMKHLNFNINSTSSLEALEFSVVKKDSRKNNLADEKNFAGLRFLSAPNNLLNSNEINDDENIKKLKIK